MKIGNTSVIVPVWRMRRSWVKCECMLGCPETAYGRGYDQLMNIVPLAKGHGRPYTQEDGS